MTIASISAMTRVRAESTKGRYDATALMEESGTADSEDGVVNVGSAASSEEESSRAAAWLTSQTSIRKQIFG